MKVIFKGLSPASAIALTLIGLCLAAPATCKPAETGWEEDFDKAGTALLQRISYEERGSGKNGDAVAVKEIGGGALRLGLKYDSACAQDRISLPFGNWNNDDNTASDWQPIDLTRYPFIEVRWRGEVDYPGCLYYCVETAGGKKLTGYFTPTPDHTEKDADGKEWKISIMRMSSDSSVPTASTPVKLLGINLMVYSPTGGKDHIVDVDYIRLRGFTEQELVAEKKVISALSDFPQARWRGFDTFFPFGVYDVGFLRDTAGHWDADYEGAFATYARNSFNYIASAYELEIVRNRGYGSEDALNNYISMMLKHVDMARANGLKISADVRNLMQVYSFADGYEQLLPITKKLAAAFPEDTIVSWQIADEPTSDKLTPLAMLVRAIREADACKRPELAVINNPAALQGYSKYLQLIYWDLYPVVQDKRDPWVIRDFAREYRKIDPNKPMWVVLPSFETRPPVPTGSYVRPSDAEMRLMSYLALSEGAKGLIWFHGWYGYGSLDGLVDRAGSPRGGMMATLNDLGKRLIPIGELLLPTDHLDAKLDVAQQDQSPGRGVSVSVLKHKNEPIYYLVAVNEDIDHTRQARVGLPAAILDSKLGVYDLYALDGRNLRSGDRFTVDALAGGDGRIYLVASAEEFRRQQTRIIRRTAEENIRTLSPDLIVAEKWKLPLDGVKSAIEDCRRCARTGKATDALATSETARSRLLQVMDSNSELNAVRHALSDIQIELSELERIATVDTLNSEWWSGRRDVQMLTPNPAFLDLSKRYWEVGRNYALLKARYIGGESQGLWTDLNKTRMDCLKVREDLLALLNQKLQAVQEPPTAK